MVLQIRRVYRIKARTAKRRFKMDSGKSARRRRATELSVILHETTLVKRGLFLDTRPRMDYTESQSVRAGIFVRR